MNTIHNFKINGLRGGEIDFAAFAGKKILIVNVASECGFTKQYTQLQELHEKLGDKIAVIGFPCNDFGGQEPGDAAAIENFCSVNFGVTFPLTEKVAILGESPHPIYKWLTSKSENGVADNEVAWNFHKFLIDEKGALVKSLPSSADPVGEEILDWVK